MKLPVVVLVVMLMSACASAPPAGRMALAKEIVTGPDLPVPVGPYSHVVRAGDFLFVSGQPGVGANGAVVSAVFEEQARQSLANLARVLRAAGSGPEHVVKTTVFLTDTANFAALNKIYAEFFPTAPPARSTPAVQLPLGILVSVDAIAIAPRRTR